MTAPMQIDLSGHNAWQSQPVENSESQMAEIEAIAIGRLNQSQTDFQSQPSLLQKRQASVSSSGTDQPSLKKRKVSKNSPTFSTSTNDATFISAIEAKCKEINDILRDSSPRTSETILKDYQKAKTSSDELFVLCQQHQNDLTDELQSKTSAVQTQIQGLSKHYKRTCNEYKTKLYEASISKDEVPESLANLKHSIECVRIFDPAWDDLNECNQLHTKLTKDQTKRKRLPAESSFSFQVFIPSTSSQISASTESSSSSQASVTSAPSQTNVPPKRSKPLAKKRPTPTKSSSSSQVSVTSAPSQTSVPPKRSKPIAKKRPTPTESSSSSQVSVTSAPSQTNVPPKRSKPLAKKRPMPTESSSSSQISVTSAPSQTSVPPKRSKPLAKKRPTPTKSSSSSQVSFPSAISQTSASGDSLKENALVYINRCIQIIQWYEDLAKEGKELSEDDLSRIYSSLKLNFENILNPLFKLTLVQNRDITVDTLQSQLKKITQFINERIENSVATCNLIMANVNYLLSNNDPKILMNAYRTVSKHIKFIRILNSEYNDLTEYTRFLEKLRKSPFFPIEKKPTSVVGLT